MKIKILALIYLVSLSGISIQAQNFESLGGGFRVTGKVNYIEFDTINNRMFVAGDFTQIENVQSQNIAYYDSTGWHGFGLGTTGAINSLKFVNDRLYIGGYINNIDGVEVENNICYWDSTGWHSMDGGVSSTVYSIEYYDSLLFVSGAFITAGGITVNNIATWDGNSWAAVGQGSDYPAVSIKVLDNILYAYARFENFNGIATLGICAFDGVNWTSRSLVDTNLYIQNITTCAGQLYASVYNDVINKTEIVQYNGSTWTTLISNLNSNYTYPLASHEDSLYVFTNSGAGPDTIFIKKYSTSGQLAETYQTIQGDANIRLEMEFAKSFNGKLYIAGLFRNFENQFASGVITMDAGSFQAPFLASSGYTSSWNYSYGYGMVFDSIQNKLIAGGRFDFAGDTLANSIASWDGTKWSPMGSGFNCTESSASVRRLEIYNGKVYAAGNFSKSGNKTVNCIAVWNGVEWDSVGAGANGLIRDMVVYKNQLYLAGTFTTFNGMQNVDGLVKYNDTAWTKNTALINNGNYVNSMCVHNNILLVTGSFDFSGSTTQIAQFDGNTWSAFPSPINATFHRIISIGGSLYIGSTDSVYKYDGSGWTSVFAAQSNWPAGFFMGSFTTAPIITDADANSTYMLDSQGQSHLLCYNMIYYSLPIDSNSAYISGFLPTIFPSGHVMNHVGILRRQLPPIQFTYSADSICDHEYVNYAATLTDIRNTYEWTFPGGIASVSSAFAPSIKYSVPGTYDVKYKVTNAFGSDSVFFQDLIFVGNCTVGLNEIKLGDLLIYPNPVSEILSIQLPKAEKINLVSVYNIIGEKEFEFSHQNPHQTQGFQFNCSNLSQGIHILVIDTENHRYVSKINKN